MTTYIKCKIKRLMLFITTIMLIAGCMGKPKEGYIITNVNIIPMNEEIVLENRNIVVKNGNIAAITDYSEKIPPNLTKIDGTGKYIIPGLMDMLTYLETHHELTLYLVNGITTIRCIAGSENMLETREKIAQGEIFGPKMYVSTPIITGIQSSWEFFNHPISSVYQVEMVLGEYKKAGYDFVSIFGDLSVDVYYEVVKTAKKLDFPVIGMPPMSVPMSRIIAGEPASMTYTFRFLNNLELIDSAVEKDIWFCPALALLHHYGRAFEPSQIKGLEYVSQAGLDYWEKQYIRSIGNINTAQDNLSLFIERGGKILAGSGAYNYYLIPGFSLHKELRLYVENGMSPFEALRSATWNPAEFLGIIDRYGSIEIGKTADLVLLEKNPLEDIGNSDTIYGVMHEGKWYNRALLDAYLQDVSNQIERWDNNEVPYEVDWR